MIHDGKYQHQQPARINQVALAEPHRRKPRDALAGAPVAHVDQHEFKNLRHDEAGSEINDIQDPRIRFHPEKKRRRQRNGHDKAHVKKASAEFVVLKPDKDPDEPQHCRSQPDIEYKMKAVEPRGGPDYFKKKHERPERYQRASHRKRDKKFVLDVAR